MYGYPKSKWFLIIAILMVVIVVFSFDENYNFSTKVFYKRFVFRSSFVVNKDTPTSQMDFRKSKLLFPTSKELFQTPRTDFHEPNTAFAIPNTTFPTTITEFDKPKTTSPTTKTEFDKPKTTSSPTTREALRAPTTAFHAPKTSLHKDKPVVREEWIDPDESKAFSDYGDGTCAENKNVRILKTILTKWNTIALENNISYFLTCGTLLGSWRDGKLVPKDTDLDILVDRKDATKLQRIKQRRNFDNYDGKFHLYLQRDWRKPYSRRRRFKCNGVKVHQYSDQCSFQEPLGRLMKDGRHLDIYDYRIENGMVIDPSEGYHEFKTQDVFPLKKCMFLGLKVNCPNKPKNVLGNYYNDLKPNKKCVDREWIKV